MSLLSKIQTELNCAKSQYNNFGKYNYRSLEDIFEGLKPLLLKYECSVMVSDEIIQVGDRYYIKATASLIDKDGKYVAENTGWARESETRKGMDDSQVTGATSSYARKYALNGLFAIDDVKDADTDAYTSKTKGATTSKPTQSKSNQGW